MAQATIDQVQWLHDLDEALRRSRAQGQPVLLDFYKDTWKGCARLSAETYPDQRVVRALNEGFVPLKIKSTEQPELAGRFDVDWTPVLLVLDSDGKEHSRFIGFLPPSEYVAMLLVGKATLALHRRHYQEASETYAQVVDGHPDSKLRPEALFFLSVARARSGDPEGAVAARAELKARYPDSLWTIRLSS